MITKQSRYASCVILTDGTRSWLGSRHPLVALPRDDDRFHQVKPHDRIDALAARYLGEATLWWVIADVNELFFPLALPVGQVLRIPSRETTMMQLVG